MALTKDERTEFENVRTTLELLKQRQDYFEEEIAKVRDLEVRLVKLEERQLNSEQAKTRNIAIIAVILSACAIVVNVIVNMLKK